MNVHEQQEVLRTMEILVDTREQPTERAKKRYQRFGCPHLRCTLSYGDYSYNATLPDGTKIYDISETVSPVCVVERKMSLDELAACFCSGRLRFIREFERAANAGARIFYDRGKCELGESFEREVPDKDCIEGVRGISGCIYGAFQYESRILQGGELRRDHPRDPVSGPEGEVGEK